MCRSKESFRTIFNKLSYKGKISMTSETWWDNEIFKEISGIDVEHELDLDKEYTDRQKKMDDLEAELEEIAKNITDLKTMEKRCEA